MGVSFQPLMGRRAEVTGKPGEAKPQLRQPRLLVGSASDPAEVEADRVADAVIADLARPEVASDRTWPAETRIRRSSALVDKPAAHRRPEDGETEPMAADVMRE